MQYQIEIDMEAALQREREYDENAALELARAGERETNEALLARIEAEYQQAREEEEAARLWPTREGKWETIAEMAARTDAERWARHEAALRRADPDGLVALAGGTLTISGKAAARLLGVGKECIYGLIARGELPAFRSGRNWHIPVKGLGAYLDRVNGRPKGGGRRRK